MSESVEMKEAQGQTAVQLARHLGVFDATMIGVGAMIGAGIFVLTGIAMGQAGPAAVIAFGLNSVVTLFTALSYAELASAIPEAGGGYSYVKKVMPNSLAFVAGWMLWFAYIVACSLYAKAFGSYFLEFFEQNIPSVTHAIIDLLGAELAVTLLTVGIGLFFVALNIVGTAATGQAENVITIAKLVVLGTFILFGLVQVFRASDQAVANFSPLFPNGFPGILAAMGLTFIAFEGYDLIATVSEEVKEPRRTIPKAIIYSLAITIVVYILVVFVTIAAVAPDEGLPTWQLIAKYGETGILRAAQGFMPGWGIQLILFGGLFATLSALNATILASSRVAFSMGRDWMLPHSLSQIHPQRRTPVLAISITGVLFLLVAIFLPLETLGSASSLLFLLTFSLVNLVLIIHRRRSTELAPFSLPFFPLTPVLGIITCFGLALYQLFNEPLAWALAGAWIVVGLIIYFAAFARRVQIADVPKIIESPEILALKKTKRYRVLVPLANPERVQPLLSLAGQVAVTSRGEVMALSVISLPGVLNYAEAEPFLQESQGVLNLAQQTAVRHNIPFSSLLKIGHSAADEIVQVAKDSQCDLILMGYKLGDDPLENSIIYRVVVGQPCDVAILKTDRQTASAYRRLLIPISGTEIHDNLKVRLVHGLVTEESEITFLTIVSPQASQRERKRAEDRLQQASNIYQLPQARRLVVEHEQTAVAIVDQAADHDLLIMGVQAESWFQSFFFGTLSQQIAGQVQCATLLVKAKSAQKATFLPRSATHLGGASHLNTSEVEQDVA